MKVNRKQAVNLREAIQEWNRTGLIDELTSQNLKSSIEVTTFDWKKLAKYSFWIALICIVTSVIAAFADKAFLTLIAVFITAPPIVRFLELFAISALFYRLGFRRRAKFPEKTFSNEAILFLGVLTTAAAIGQLWDVVLPKNDHYSLVLLLSSLVYGGLGYFFNSNLIWLFSLLSLGSWMGAETGYASGWGAYYLGMNFPLRFVLFGGVLTASALALETKQWFTTFFRTSLILGLLYLFIALWILSIFGNYGDAASWKAVKQIELFHWSLLFGIAACGSIVHGLKFENGVTKGFGITFLFINLYTRFFEYFWTGTHKAIFFGLLGISFWFVGSRAEKIWQIGEKTTAKAL